MSACWTILTHSLSKKGHLFHLAVSSRSQLKTSVEKYWHDLLFIPKQTAAVPCSQIYWRYDLCITTCRARSADWMIGSVFWPGQGKVEFAFATICEFCFLLSKRDVDSQTELEDFDIRNGMEPSPFPKCHCPLEYYLMYLWPSRPHFVLSLDLCQKIEYWINSWRAYLLLQTQYTMSMTFYSTLNTLVE